jgi:hypothetical protein
MPPSDFPASGEELRAAARAAIKAGKLPMPNSEHGGTIQRHLVYVPTPILCIVCGGYMRPGHQPYQLTSYPGEPQMHYPGCFNTWLAAARDELAERDT